MLKFQFLIKRGRLALCTEFGAGHWRMIFLDTLEESKVPPFANAKRGRWFAQLEDGNWQMVDASAFPELELFEVQLEGVDKQCCLKVCHKAIGNGRRIVQLWQSKFDSMT